MTTAYVDLNCEKCGTPYTIRRDSYYHRKSKGRPNLCGKCRKVKHQSDMSEWHANLTEEQKEQRGKQQGIKWRENWNNKSEEERNKLLETLYEGRDNHEASMSEEERNKRNEERRIISQNMWANRSEEERERIVNAMHEGKKNYYDNLSEEERADKIKKLCEGFKNWRENMTEEDKAKESEARRARWFAMSAEEQRRSLDTLHREWKAWYSNLNEEEMKEYRNSIHKYWENMTQEGFIEWINRREEGITQYYKDMDGPKNLAELMFASMLDEFKIDYEWQYLSKKIHPLFTIKFPNNPVLNRRVSPFHRWDFLVKTRHGEVLVDVDGSIHDVGNKYITRYGAKIKELMMFNDNKRFYQTDGKMAYVVKVPNDVLQLNSPVMEIDSKNMCIKSLMEYKDFLLILKFMNFTDKEIRDIMEAK